MEILWFIYNVAMCSLLFVGSSILIICAYRATRRGLLWNEIGMASFGIAIFGGSLVYWHNGSQQLYTEMPRWYFAFCALFFGYGGHGMTLWALDPDRAKELTGRK